MVESATVPAVCRDPQYDIFLATAGAAGASYLVSEDQDLLILKEYEGSRLLMAEPSCRYLSIQ